MEKIQTANAWMSPNPLSQAMRVGDVLYVSGQLGMDPRSGELAGVGIGEQTRAAIANLTAVLEAAGGSLKDVVKTTCFLTDLARDAGEFNRIYAESFEHRPARSTIGVADLGPGRLVEIEAVAIVGDGER